MGYSSHYIELYPIVPDCIKSYPHLESHISSNYDHNILIQNSLISRYHLIPAAEAGHQFKALTPSDRRSYGLAQRSGGRSEGLSNDLDALGYPHFTKPPYGVDLTVSSGSKTFGLQLYWLYRIRFFTCKTMPGVGMSHIPMFGTSHFKRPSSTLVSHGCSGITWIDCQLQEVNGFIYHVNHLDHFTILNPISLTPLISFSFATKWFRGSQVARPRHTGDATRAPSIGDEAGSMWDLNITGIYHQPSWVIKNLILAILHGISGSNFDP